MVVVVVVVVVVVEVIEGETKIKKRAEKNLPNAI